MALAKFFRFPFGTSGDRAAVPDPVDVSGNVSYEQGYGPDYQRANTDPLSKDIERNKANQLQYDITLALREYQVNGTPDWITAAQNNGVAYPYPQYARVRGSDGITYTSTINANTNTPPHATWVADTIATPPQFDNDLSMATTAFVQRALGSFSGHTRPSGDITLTVADVGRTTALIGGNAILPLASAVPLGARIPITAGGAPRTVSPQGGDTLARRDGSSGTITLLTNGLAYFERNFAGDGWFQAEGDSALQYSPYFAAVKAGNGYQKLPSGLILQWGVLPAIAAGATVQIAYPISFPNSCFVAIGSPGATSGGSGSGLSGYAGSGGVGGNPLTGCSFSNQSASAATQQGTFLAIGV